MSTSTKGKLCYLSNSLNSKVPYYSTEVLSIHLLGDKQAICCGTPPFEIEAIQMGSFKHLFLELTVTFFSNFSGVLKQTKDDERKYLNNGNVDHVCGFKLHIFIVRFAS